MSVSTPVRSEVECVGDALVALLSARLLPTDKAADACQVAGITLADLNDARIRRENGRSRPARRIDAWPNPEPVKSATPSPTPSPPAPSLRFGDVIPRPADPDPPRDQSGRKRHGRYGESFCVDCGLWKERSEVEHRRCRECRNKARRMRYLSVEREAGLLEVATRWARSQVDPELVCGQCRRSIDVDEEVVLVGEVRCGNCLGTEKGLVHRHSGRLSHGRGRIGGMRTPIDIPQDIALATHNPANG